MGNKQNRRGEEIDYSSNQEFFDYYAQASESEETISRFHAIRDMVLVAISGRGDKVLSVADIGCGAGTQSIIWAKMGHKVSGIDINEPLVSLARTRAEQEGLDIELRVGLAEKLPWADASMDICLVPELLEHVTHWEACLDEFARILSPGGILFISTNNILCPVQEEFSLPLYSWYPAFLKHHFERLAVTTKPWLVNYAKYPAINWFSFYGLRKELESRGLRSMDRFDVVNPDKLALIARLLLSMIRKVPPVRFVSHVFTPYTLLLSIKQ